CDRRHQSGWNRGRAPFVPETKGVFCFWLPDGQMRRQYARIMRRSWAMAERIVVTLPDGSKREVPRGTTPAEVAASLGQRLAKEALVARWNGKLIDLSRPLE